MLTNVKYRYISLAVKCGFSLSFRDFGMVEICLLTVLEPLIRLHANLLFRQRTFFTKVEGEPTFDIKSIALR